VPRYRAVLAAKAGGSRARIGTWRGELRTLITVVLVVPLMTWLFMPAVTRLVFRWLYSD
jgi:antibiotic biosynthesis monooxygenase (ABM) superfamily enzyme